jgi:hypothetical protein
MTERYPNVNAQADDLSGLCRIGGFAAFGLILYTLATIVQFAIVGVGVPPTAFGIFNILHNNRIEGLLRLDLPTVIAMPLYYMLFLGLFAALRRIDRAHAILSTALAFVGTTLLLATPTALPMLSLSDQYWAATTEASRVQYLAAGEAVMATDIWHGTGALVGGVLLQFGALLICWVMLRGGVFGRATAWLGIIMHALDLAHLISGHFLPPAGIVLMAIAGPLYPIWFFLVGRRLLKLAAS